jgi:hypothetical protein
MEDVGIQDWQSAVKESNSKYILTWDTKDVVQMLQSLGDNCHRELMTL